MTPPINPLNDQNACKANTQRTVPPHRKFCSRHNRKHSHLQIHFPLTASLPVFDGKSEKFEIFEDLFRNNIKMYPHLTEIQKSNYFHSLLRGNALQAYCNLDDTKKDNLEEVITAFKRRFGDFQSAAKARCEWDALHFDPTKQKLHEFLDM